MQSNAKDSEPGDFDNPLKASISLLSGLGAIETGYLTLNKLTDPTMQNLPLCTSASCSSVLSSPYSALPILNIPLVFVGFLLYLAVFFTSQMPTRNQEKKSTFILSATTAMATFSGYLIWLLTSVLHDSCLYCYLSAFFSFSLAAISWYNKIVPNATKTFVVMISSVSISLLSAGLLFYSTSLIYNTDAAQASTAPAAQILAMDEIEAKSPPTISKHSSEKALLVAKRLSQANANMYGAYWCSHCFNQKQELGLEAYENKLYSYIECDKQGKDSKFDVCRSKKIPGYPTWELNGRYYPGEKNLDELDALLNKIEAER